MSRDISTRTLRRWLDERGPQAAPLFAFARARDARVGVVALVSNVLDHAGEQSDTGGHDVRPVVLTAIARAAGEALSA